MKYINKQTGEIVKAFNRKYQNDGNDNLPKWGMKRLESIIVMIPELEWVVLNKDKEMILYRDEAFIEKFDELSNKKFKLEDLERWGYYTKDYFIDILNGDYDLETARQDLRSLI